MDGICKCGHAYDDHDCYFGGEGGGFCLMPRCPCQAFDG